MKIDEFRRKRGSGCVQHEHGHNTRRHQSSTSLCSNVSAGFLQDNLLFRDIIQHCRRKLSCPSQYEREREKEKVFIWFALYSAAVTQTVRYSAAGKRVRTEKKKPPCSCTRGRASLCSCTRFTEPASLSHPDLTYFRRGLPSSIACLHVFFCVHILIYIY